MSVPIASKNLVEFFRERVQEALGRQKVNAPVEVEFYLVNLLKDYLKVEELFSQTPDGRRQEALALLLGQAMESDAHRKIHLFKRIGDTSLFTAGFFPASLNRRLVDIDYYIQMGGSAYDSLSHILSGDPSFEEIYKELSRHFVAYVDILTDVSEKSEFLKDSDILRIYEKWLKTGSQHAKQRLSEEGILPLDVPLKFQ